METAEAGGFNFKRFLGPSQELKQREHVSTSVVGWVCHFKSEFRVKLPDSENSLLVPTLF